ncbi:hypothetical protein HHI36_021495 [Cryptolaemus montrouzieri]|uniref:Uncharacterized protein n=1 Tax=Cryptolaemus montrouzieri TaxID=559131 RepID=A0ABD2MXE5_9CUCU
MLPVKNVELTKVHYFEPNKHHRNVSIPTVSQEVFENTFNRNVIIKKNIFGHKWVLKINELENGNIKKKKSVKCWIYSAVFLCILVAVASSLFYTLDLEKRIFSKPCIQNQVTDNSKSTKNISIINNSKNQSTGNDFLNTLKVNNSFENFPQDGLPNINSNFSNTKNQSTKIYCIHCTNNQVCLKTEEIEKPKCIDIVDKLDPTGCGGLCLLDVEFCALLDKKHRVFQCSPLRNLLRCPKDTFNCGEQCIATKNVCDGVVHCRNAQDEKHCDCDLEKNFICTNSTSCLPKVKKCDGIIDCWDKSDESQCHKGCPIQDYSCLNGQCIPKEQFCDGIANCLDSSDEPQGCQL